MGQGWVLLIVLLARAAFAERWQFDAQGINAKTYEWTHLKYDVDLADNVVVLTREPSVQAVNCTDNHLLLTVNDTAPALSWGPGTLLAGHKSWGCTSPPSTKPKPFYRFVKVMSMQEAPDAPNTMSTVVVQTEMAIFEQCFKRADIQFYRRPAWHPENPQFARSGNSSTKQAKGPRELIGVDLQVGLDVLSFNYDSYFGQAEEQMLEIETQTDDLSISCRNCYGYLNVGLNFVLRFSASLTDLLTLEEFELSLNGGLEFNANLDMEATTAVDEDIPSVVLSELSDVGRTTFEIATVELGLDFSTILKASGSVTTNGMGLANAGIYYNRQVTYGIRYENGPGWDVIQYDSENSFFEPLTLTFPGNVKLEVDFATEVTATLWDIIPFSVAPVTTFQLLAGPQVGCEAKGYESKWGLALEAKLGQLIIDLPGFDPWRFDLGVLPLSSRKQVISMTPIPGDWASGCLSSSPASEFNVSVGADYDDITADQATEGKFSSDLAISLGRGLINVISGKGFSSSVEVGSLLRGSIIAPMKVSIVGASKEDKASIQEEINNTPTEELFAGNNPYSVESITIIEEEEEVDAGSGSGSGSGSNADVLGPAIGVPVGVVVLLIILVVVVLKKKESGTKVVPV